ILFVYFVSYEKRLDYGIEGYTIWALAFTGLVVVLSMKLSCDCSILTWMGQHVFSVYILQRIPMILLAHFGMTGHKYFFLIFTILCTVFLAIVFDYWIDKLIDKIRKSQIDQL
ncbi:MAG: hypothetical protein PUH29_03550, partial [Lachnospiraceae bacterium]|nr:hypothetical protein [Lachnospiraceae bacterium]